MRHDVVSCCVRVAALSAARVHFESTRGFYFVSASYQGRSLLSAASHLAKAVKEALGPDRHPHLITLFATAHDEWGAGLSDTPKYVRALLSTPGVPPPVVLGGVLRGVTCGLVTPQDPQPCVALLAAHLPGVKILPFHATHGSLPSLTGGSWADVMRAARPPVQHHNQHPNTAAAAAATAPAAAPHYRGDAASCGAQGQRTLHNATASSCLPHGANGTNRINSSNISSASSTTTSMSPPAAAPSSPGVIPGWAPSPPPTSCPGSSIGLIKAEAGQRAGGASGGVGGDQQSSTGPAAAASGRAVTYRQPQQHSEALQHPPQHQSRSSGRAGESSSHAKGVGTMRPERSAVGRSFGGSVLGGGVGCRGPSLPQVAAGRGQGTGADLELAAAGRQPQPPPPARESVAALLLSTPHFMGQVEELLRRVGLVAPGLQVVGGVTAPGVWGDSEGDWGAVWLNDSTFAQGAVGCVLRGPFKLDSIVSPGFRGAGPLMRVTQAQGAAVLELDGEPVQRPLQRAIAAALSSGDAATSLKMGVGEPGAPAGTPSSSSSSSSSSSTPAAPFPSPPPPPPPSSSQHHHQHPHRAQQLSSPPAASSPLHPVLPPAQQHTGLPFQSGEHTQPGQQQEQQHHQSHHQQAQAQVLRHPPPPHSPLQQPHQRPEQASPAALLPDEPPAVWPPPQQPHPQLVTRNWFFQQGPPRPHLTIQSSGPIAPGTPIQLHVQNYPAAQHQMQSAVQHYAQQLPPNLVTRIGGVGALALSCAGLPFCEQPDVAQWLPGAAFLGGQVEGELCATATDQSPRLHSFTSCLALLRPADKEPNDCCGQEDECGGGGRGGGELGIGAGQVAEEDPTTLTAASTPGAAVTAMTH